MKIIIEKYNPTWKIIFEVEQQLLEKRLNDSKIQVEHIGSTSVEGLGAKPVIDIMIGVPNFEIVNNYIPLIQSIGYKYIDEYEDVMPYRRFFIKESKGKRSHHIHMVEVNTEFWNRHLFFKNYLRSHSETKETYYQLKKDLCKQEWNHSGEYAEAKTDFIRNIEKKRIEL